MLCCGTLCWKKRILLVFSFPTSKIHKGLDNTYLIHYFTLQIYYKLNNGMRQFNKFPSSQYIPILFPTSCSLIYVLFIFFILKNDTNNFHHFSLLLLWPHANDSFSYQKLRSVYPLYKSLPFYRLYLFRFSKNTHVLYLKLSTVLFYFFRNPIVCFFP